MNKIKNKIYTLLRRSEKWTGTDMVYLAKGGFWLTGKNVIASLTALVLAIAYANLLPKDTYAQYKYILSIVSLLTITTLPGMLTAVTRAVAMGYEGSVFKALKTRLIWSLLGLLGGIITAGYYIYQGNKILGYGILIAAVFHLITVDLIYAPYLQGKKQFKPIAIYKSIQQILITVFIITSLFISNNILFFLSVYFISTFLTHIFFFIYVFKKNKLNKKTDNESLSFGKHLSLMGILGTISEQIDKIIIWHLIGPIQLAIYSFAILPVKQATNLIQVFSTLALPKLSAQNKEILKKTLPIKILKFSIILIIPALIYILIATPIFKLVFPEYLDSIKYTKIYAISLILYPLRFFGTAISAHGKTKYLYILKISSSIIKIISFAILIYFFGIYGAIATLLLLTIFNGTLAGSLFKKI